MAYLDDIIIFSRNEREHLKNIQIIFQKLIDAGLKLKESKCDFFKKEIHYLGTPNFFRRNTPTPGEIRYNTQYA